MKYAKEGTSSLNPQAKKYSLKDFNKLKQSLPEINSIKNSKNINEKVLEEKTHNLRSSQPIEISLNKENSNSYKYNDLYFYKNIHGYPMKQIKNFNLNKKGIDKKSIISKDAPEWFNVIDDKKLKALDDKMKSEETVSIISKFQSWITVTPKTKNRKRPLEKERIESMDKTSKIMPKWMQPVFSERAKKTGFGKSNKDRFMENPLKSVFSIMDYRHNLITSEECKEKSKNIPPLPKKFFDFDDCTRFVPGKNIDVPLKEIKEKQLKLK